MAAESDNAYKARLKSTIPQFIGGGTNAALEQSINAITGALLEDIEVITVSPGNFIVRLHHVSTFTVQVIIDAIDKTKADGILWDNAPDVWLKNEAGISADYEFEITLSESVEIVAAYSSVWIANETKTESVNITDTNDMYHYADVTYIDSLNVVA